MATENFPIRVLLIEDDEDDSLLIGDQMSLVTVEKYELEWVAEYEEGLEALLNRSFDVCILDYCLGERSGLDLLREALSRGCTVPVILLTGVGDYRVDFESMQAGVADYLTKGEMSPSLLERAIRYSIDRKQATDELRKTREELEHRVLERTEELAKANEALREKEIFARSILDALSTHIAILDGDGFILCTNRSWETFAASNRLVGYDFHDVNYLSVCDVVHGEGEEIARLAAAGIREVIAGLRDWFELEYPCHSPDEKRWFNMRAMRMSDSEPVQVVVAHEDITERKLAEEELDVQNARIQAVLDNMPSGVILYELEPFRPVLVNRAGEELIGRSLPEVISVEDLASYFHTYRTGTDESYPVQRMPIVRALAGQSVSIDDMEMRRPDGSRVRIEVFGAPVRNTSGSITGAVAIFHDVSRRKMAEEALRESEEHYRSLFDHMLNGFAYCQMHFYGDQPEDFTYLNVNAAFESLTGLRDVIGRKASEVIPGIRQSDPELLEIYGRVALTGKPEAFEVWVEALAMWFSVSVYSPRKEHFVAIFDVITERKQTEQALRKSEERFRLAMDATSDGLWDWDLSGGGVYYSPGYFRMLGYEPGEFPVPVDAWLDLVHPEDRERALAAKDACIRNDSPTVNVEFRMHSRDGSWRWILGRGKAVRRDANGRALQLIGTHVDITDRRSTEEALRLSEEKSRERAEELEKLMDLAPMSIWIAQDPQCRKITGNRAAIRFWEAAEGENLSACLGTDQPGPYRRFFRDGRELAPEELPMQYAVSNGVEVLNEEVEIMLPSGRRVTLFGSASPLLNSSGDVRGCVAGFMDITERKQAENFVRIERDLALGLGSTSTLTQAFEFVLDACLEIDDLDCGGIYVVESERGGLDLLCHKGLSDAFVRQWSFLEQTSPVALFVMQGEPGYWPRPADILGMNDLAAREGLLALVVAPVIVDGAVVASLNLASHVESEIPRNIRNTVELIASHISGAVSRVRLGETIRVQRERLEESNAALRVLLKQREHDRAELEESLVSNVKHLVLPYLDKLRKSRLANDQRHIFEILDSHLREITAPFARKISAPMLGLTPTEIRVAELIRQGMSSKDIADLLATSESAVIFHRQGIRRKLGLIGKHINLQTYLATLM